MNKTCQALDYTEKINITTADHDLQIDGEVNENSQTSQIISFVAIGSLPHIGSAIIVDG